MKVHVLYVPGVEEGGVHDVGADHVLHAAAHRVIVERVGVSLGQRVLARAAVLALLQVEVAQRHLGDRKGKGGTVKTAWASDIFVHLDGCICL